MAKNIEKYTKAIDSIFKKPVNEDAKKEPLLDEDGKEMKLTLQVVCSGILFWGSVIGLAVCAGLRGCQEYKKHHDAPKTIVKAHAESNINAVPQNIFVKTR